MEEDAPHLTAAQVEAYLARLQPLHDEIVLIGGQALNVWVDRYGGVPELSDAAPFTSKDIDFCGGPEQARRCAAILGGTAQLFTIPDRTTCAGIVRCPDGTQMDFLRVPLGVSPQEMQRRSVPFEHARVLHPMDVLRSRAANIARIPRRTAHAFKQLRASIVVVREFARDVLDSEAATRAVLKLNDEIADLACSDDGLTVWHLHQIDVFNAMLIDARLPQDFVERRVPQLRDHLAKKRAARRPPPASEQPTPARPITRACPSTRPS